MILGTTFCTYESAFTPEECDKIIELGLKSNKQKGTTWGNQEKTDDKKVSQANKTIHELQNEHGKSINDINPYIRDSEISWLKEQWIYDKLHGLVLDANQKSGWNFEFDTAQEMQFTTYQKDGFYGWHADSGICHHSKYLRDVSEDEKIKGKEHFYTKDLNSIGKIRKLSMTLNLSDPSDYEGGYLMFDLGEHQPDSKNNKMEEIKKRGSLIIFPSFLYHQVSPVTKGTRHSLVCWILGAPFK